MGLSEAFEVARSSDSLQDEARKLPPRSTARNPSQMRSWQRRGLTDNGSNASESLFVKSLRNATNLELEELLFSEDTSRPNRGCLGRGELHWYKLRCRTNKLRAAVDELVASGYRVAVPRRKEPNLSSSGRRSWRSVKYEDGMALLVLCRLGAGEVEELESMEHLDEAPWEHAMQYSSLGAPSPMVLPRPMTCEEIDEVHRFESSGPPGATEFARMEDLRLSENGHYSPPIWG